MSEIDIQQKGRKKSLSKEPPKILLLSRPLLQSLCFQLPHSDLLSAKSDELKNKIDETKTKFGKEEYEEALSKWTTRLLLAKSRLDLIDGESWRKLINLVTIDKTIPYILRKEERLPLVTAAWLKMHQLLKICKFEEILLQKQESNSVLFTFHLCEAPGAFISALLHYIKQRSKINHCFKSVAHKWWASSLATDEPNMHVGPPTSFSAPLVGRFSNWIYGKSGSGDITDPQVINDLWTTAFKHSSTGMDLVTADGGMECRPEVQESVCYNLIYFQTIAALGLLRIGGTLMLKVFTIHEFKTAEIMYLIYKYFKNVQIIKPPSSKSTNSEKYILATSFKGICAIILKHLLYKDAHNDTNIEKEEKEKENIFFRSLVSIEMRIARHQIYALDNLLDWFLFLKPQICIQQIIPTPALAISGLYTTMSFEEVNCTENIERIRDWQKDYARWYIDTQI